MKDIVVLLLCTKPYRSRIPQMKHEIVCLYHRLPKVRPPNGNSSIITYAYHGGSEYIVIPSFCVY